MDMMLGISCSLTFGPLQCDVNADEEQILLHHIIVRSHTLRD